MPGGLELAANSGPTGGGPAGALEQATAENPFDSAIESLRMSSRISGSPVDEFAARANDLWKEARPRIEESIEGQRTAGERTMNELRHPPINRDIPYLRFAAGMMAPTKTGAFGESLGHGIGELASGLGDVNKSELDFHRRAAESGYGIAKDRTSSLEQMYGLGLKADQIEAAMSMLKNRSKPDLVKLQEYINSLPEGPEKEQMKSLITLRYGTSQMKNSSAILGSMLDPNHPSFQRLTQILANQPLMARLQKQAQMMVPREQYIGKTQADYAAAVSAQFQQLVHEAVTSGGADLGSPGGAGAPAALPGAPAAPGAPPVAPGPGATPAGPPAGGASNAAEQQPLGDTRVSDFPTYIASQAKAWQQNPLIVQDAASRKRMDDAAIKDYEEHVLPGVHSGEELQNAVNSLDAINPKTTPVSGLVQALGKAGAVLGLPENNSLVTRAADLNTGEKVVRELQNAILIKAKGVQTEGDARRALTQIAHMSDMPQVYEASKTLMRAIGQRAMDKGDFYNRYGELNAGQFTGANTEWARLASGVPLIKRVKFADGSSGFLTYKEVIEQHLKQGDTMAGAIAALRKGD